MKLRESASKLFSDSRALIVISGLMAIGVATILGGHAATITHSLQPETGNAPGYLIGTSDLASGKQFIRFGSGSACDDPAYTYNGYRRPYGPRAAYNVPACAVGKWNERSDDWVNRLASYGIQANPTRYDNNGVSTLSTNLDFGVEFGPVSGNLNGTDYSIPVYDARTATEQVRVFINRSYLGYNANLGGTYIDSPSYNWDAKAPWNPAWLPSDGFDQLLIAINPDTGQEWFYWAAIRQDMPSHYDHNTSGCITTEALLHGYNPAVDLCAAALRATKTTSGQPADFRTFEGNQPGSSGGGLQNYAGLVTPEEVASGKIRHAMKFPISNPMFGPACSKSLNINDPSVGTTCGTEFAPAGNFEAIGNTTGLFGGTRLFAPGNTPDERRANTVPEGLRFALNITDGEINSWLDSRGYTGRKRETARIFAVAMRDYGIIITDGTAGGAFIQTAGSVNPDTAQKWKDLGLTDDSYDLLFKLVTKDRLYALKPAINECADGTTSHYYCPSDLSHY